MIVKIKNLEIDCNIGVYEWEKTYNRKLLINIEMQVDNLKVLETQKLEDTIDYEQIYNNTKKIVFSKYYELLENLANDIVDMILQHKLISSAKVEIDKIFIFEDVASCSVIIEKNKYNS
jgi:dihydroneopterin aldolase